MREIVTSETFTKQKIRLPLLLGRDAAGKPLVEDLAGMPHMLIAGTTGAGKTVCVKTLLASLLSSKTPEELQLVLIDPKMVELSGYKTLPHLMHPVVTDMKRAEAILAWAVEKMEERYSLLAKAGVRVNVLRSSLGERLDGLPQVSGASGEANLSNDTIKLLNIMDKLAQDRGDAYIASELFVLAALNLARELASFLDYPHYAVGHNVTLRRGRYGNATLSKHPILRERNINLTVSWRKPRGAQHTNIRLPAKRRGVPLAALLRDRLAGLGPVSREQLARALAVDEGRIDTALLRLQGQGRMSPTGDKGDLFLQVQFVSW